jgi:hypothetical protein
MADTTELVQVNITRMEALILALWRKQSSRMVSLPVGWTFTIDCKPDRLLGSFMDKELVEVKLGDGRANGNGR